MMEVIFMLALLFGAGFIAASFSRLFNLPIVPFLVLSGLISSFFIEFEPTELLAVGILFLIFYIGLRTDLQGFRKISSDSINIALVQVLVAGSLGFIVANIMDFTLVESLYIALAAGLGSTLAGTDLFDQKMRMDLHHGKISTGTNLIQDIIAVILIAAIASYSIGEAYINVALIIALLLISIGIRYLLSPLIQLYLKTVELQALFILSVFSLSASIGYYTSISMVASCFAGGLAFSKGLRTDELLDSIEHIKDFFAVITFVGIGALVSIQSLTSIYLAIAILVLVLIVRPIVIFLTALIDDKSSLTSFKITLNLSEVSEFVLAAVLIAMLEGSISDIVFDSIVIAMAASMILVGLASHRKYYLFEKLAWPFRRTKKFVSGPSKKFELEEHVILAGFGGIGAKIAEDLKDENQEFVVVDYNKENIDEANIKDYQSLFADLTDQNTWKTVNYTKSDIIVVTTTNPLVLQKLKTLEHNSIVLVDSEDQLTELADYSYIRAMLKDKLIDDSLKNELKHVLIGKKGK